MRVNKSFRTNRFISILIKCQSPTPSLFVLRKTNLWIFVWLRHVNNFLLTIRYCAAQQHQINRLFPTKMATFTIKWAQANRQAGRQVLLGETCRNNGQAVAVRRPGAVVCCFVTTLIQFARTWSGIYATKEGKKKKRNVNDVKRQVL